MAGWAPNSWGQRPPKIQCPPYSYHSSNHQQQSHHLYEHLPYAPQSPTLQQTFHGPSSYPVSPHIPRARTFPSYNNYPPPRHVFPSVQATSGCITSHQKGPPCAASRRGSRHTITVRDCSSILGVDLTEPREQLPNGVLLFDKLRRQDAPHRISHQDLLEMFQNVYGRMLKSVEHIVDNWLRSKVSCRAAVRRFDERNGCWKVCESRLAMDGENFYCAPYIEVVFAKLPHLTTIRELIGLIRTHCFVRYEHMQPAYKFRDEKSSWKFEPGLVYLTVDAEHLTAKRVIDNSDWDGAGQPRGQRGQRGTRRHSKHYMKEIEEVEGGSTEMSPSSSPKELRYLKRYALASSKRCREVVRSLSVKHFGFESVVWAGLEDLEFRFGNWYPLGSADQTFGLTRTSREIVQYYHEDTDDDDEAQSEPDGKPKSRHNQSSRELHDIAPTIHIVFPVDRIKSAEDKDSAGGPLVKFVEEIRSKLSAISTTYGQFALLIFWGEDRDTADWFGPEAVYKPTGDGEKYMASTEGCEK